MEDKIVLKHSRIEINNYEMGDCPSLEYNFSVYNPIYHTSFLKCIEFNEEKKQLRIPRGVDIDWLKCLFLCEPVVDKKCDEYVDNNPIPIKYKTKDDRQLNILRFILGKDQYRWTSSKSQLSCNSTTGSGKTFITVAAICYTGCRSIIITSSLNWLKQWEERIYEYTPLQSKDIYTIAGKGSIDKLLCRDPLQYQIFLVSHSTIKSYGDTNGWESVENLFKYLRCSFKVYDEAHLYFDNMCKIDFHSNTRKTLYLTATPERSNKEENVIYQNYFRNVPSIELFDQSSDPHVHYMAFHFNSHPKPLDIQKCKGAYGFNRIAYIKYIVNQPNFIKMLIIVIDTIMKMRGKALFYIGTNDAIKIVYDEIVNRFPYLDDSVGIYSSISTGDKESNLRKKIILSTTKSCGAASDIKDLACTVNLAEPFTSPVLARQTLGRCRMNNSVYIDLVDEGFFYTKRYFKNKRPIFMKYAKSCKDIYFTDEEELSKRANSIMDLNYNTTMICSVIYPE